MNDHRLYKKARLRERTKRAYVIIATVFASISVLLMTLSIKIGGDAAFWLRFPILIFCLILIILYIAFFGISRGYNNWDDQTTPSQLNAGGEFPLFRTEVSSMKPYREQDLV